MWRLNRVAGRVGRFRRVKVSILDVLIPFSALLGLNAVFMLVWTSVDPMYWTRTSRCGSDDFTSYGSCLIGNNPTSIAMVSCVVAINFLAIILANYEAFRARRYTTEFGERKYIALAMASILQIMMVSCTAVTGLNVLQHRKLVSLLTMASQRLEFLFSFWSRKTPQPNSACRLASSPSSAYRFFSLSLSRR